MSKILGHKQQLALAVLKGKKVELQKLQEDYIKRWKLHASRQGKDPSKPPRTIYADMIQEYVDRIDCEIKEISERSNQNVQQNP